MIQIRKKEENLTQTLRTAVQEVVPQAAAKGIALGARVEENLRVSHDRKWTEEAVYNLLENAVKYTKAGGSILIYAGKGEFFTEIHVEDTGKGIKKERQAQIFNRFYREPEVHSEEGIGIGLYLVRQIAEGQGGYVKYIQSREEGRIFVSACQMARRKKGDSHSFVIMFK